jgi:hypothetical protein
VTEFNDDKPDLPTCRAILARVKSIFEPSGWHLVTRLADAPRTRRTAADRAGHPCLCKQHRRRKPIGVGRASLLERLSQTCFGLLSDCAACGVLDG